MSIRIDPNKCIGCGKCCEVCPGSLIVKNEENKSDIKYPRDCWGCTSCLKECQAGAIRYYLGADMGGNGSYLYTKKDRHFLHWHIVKENTEEIITINQLESNNY
ncbi:4Fe-4S dicluster domain-containing protein [Clostridium aminobutyricum]|uniref:Ferredoxin family protein n=1 Tax=Clostridium aminobutyricum TaxID=33953 RepID=A0A939IGT5_CLOAM|nr:ferredoxin family protein [Clostridium aminobutyricum]MBN7772482.1 ferredoxin family protein [Clostridium aminobutyricum]